MKILIPLLLTLALDAGAAASTATIESPLSTTRGWRWSVDGSLQDQTGNTYARAMTGTTKLEGVRGPLGAIASFKAAQSRSRDRLTGESFVSYEKARLHWSEMNYIFEKFLWKRDRFALLRAQYDLSGGFGARLLNLKHDEFSVELGGGQIFEDRIGIPNNRADTYKTQAQYQHMFAPGSSFNAEAEYTHNLRKGQDWRWKFTAALSAPIGPRLQLQANYDYEFVNLAPAGVSRVDRTIGASLGVRFGGLEDFDETDDYGELSEDDEAPETPESQNQPPPGADDGSDDGSDD